MSISVVPSLTTTSSSTTSLFSPSTFLYVISVALTDPVCGVTMMVDYCSGNTDTRYRSAYLL